MKRFQFDSIQGFTMDTKHNISIYFDNSSIKATQIGFGNCITGLYRKEGDGHVKIQADS